MADLLKDDKLQGNDPNSQGTQTSSDASALSGGGSNDVGSGQASTAGIGPGGQGAWTNIQAYLGANKGDTGSSTLLDNTVGSQFDKEKQNMTDDSNKYVNDAQTQVDKNKMTTDTADQNLDTASRAYNYSGPQSDDYKNTVNSMQSYLNGNYTGPSSYSYTTSAETQKDLDALNNKGGFDNLMSGIYSTAAGHPLTGGQYNLQKQFDVNNPNLETTKQNLLTNYYNNHDKIITDADSQLGDLSNKDRGYRSALSDYLYGKSNSIDTAEQQAEIDARKNYATDLGQGSGLSSSGYNYLNANSNGDNLRGVYNANTSRILGNNNIFGNNMTYGQLESEHNLSPTLRNDAGWLVINGDNPNAFTHEDFARNSNALNNFYNTEDQKYANTGDDQKRQWNAIQDFLGSNSAKKSQGFKVRG